VLPGSARGAEGMRVVGRNGKTVVQGALFRQEARHLVSPFSSFALLFATYQRHAAFFSSSDIDPDMRLPVYISFYTFRRRVADHDCV